MTNKKIYIFQLFFPLGSGPAKGMTPVNVFFKFFLSLRPPCCKCLDGFGFMCVHLGHFCWPNRLLRPYYITYFIHLLSKKILIAAQAAFTWNPILKLTHREQEKLLPPSGQVYLLSCLGVIWNSYRDRFHIGYFDRFETQHPLWLVLHLFVKKTSHENIKIMMTHCSKYYFSQQRVVNSPEGKVHDE